LAFDCCNGRREKSHSRRRLHVTAGVGFGINVLAEELPAFLARYPELALSLDLSSRTVDLLAENVDVAVRLGPMTNSELVSVRIGAMSRHLCAAPAYLDRRGTPDSLDDLAEHDTVEMPGGDGRPRPWVFAKSDETKTLDLTPRISVNEAVTVYRFIANGAGIGIVSGYLCKPDFAARRLVPLFPDWSVPSVEVHAVFASKRELSPNVREFVNFMKEISASKLGWNS
jgi:LysR family transcriptional regulator for bpeEF and oprC